MFRVSVTSHKLEEVVDLKNFHGAPFLVGYWIGLAPDDSPLIDTRRRDLGLLRSPFDASMTRRETFPRQTRRDGPDTRKARRSNDQIRLH